MSLAPLRVPTAGFLSTRWSPLRVPFQQTAEILSNSMHPLYARTQSEFFQTPVGGLRWKVVTNMSKKHLGKEVTRRRLKRRWQAAFMAAFKSRGLDNNGKVLTAGKNGAKRTDLTGTLEIHIYAGQGFDDPFRYLVQQADATLAAIAKKM